MGTATVVIRVALVVLLLGALVGCGNGTATVQDDTPPQSALKSVTSGCDEFGNRIYIRGDGPNYALFVLGADPTCKR
jgi:hypothetical protein